MKKILTIMPFCLAFVLVAFTGFNKETVDFKCMVSMKSYEGEGAYLVMSVLDKDENYVKTIRLFGQDDYWWYELVAWWDFYGKKRTNLDAITGATLSGGKRAVVPLKFQANWLELGYKLRIESAVEDEDYTVNEVLFELNEENLNKTHQGATFINQVRFVKR